MRLCGLVSAERLAGNRSDVQNEVTYALLALATRKTFIMWKSLSSIWEMMTDGR